MSISEVVLPSEWADRVNGDREFTLASRWTDVDLELAVVGAHPTSHAYRIAAGRFGPLERPRADRLVRLEGSAHAWNDYLCPVPAPPNHHVLAMDRRRRDFQVVEAGRHLLIQNLRVIDLALQLMRPAPPTDPEERQR